MLIADSYFYAGLWHDMLKKWVEWNKIVEI